MIVGCAITIESHSQNGHNYNDRDYDLDQVPGSAD